MSTRTIPMTEELHAYMLRTAVVEPPLLSRLRKETATLSEARMQISPEQGRFLQLLVELIGAKLAVEVGVFTGYSALCVAMSLPPNGRLIACDVSEPWTAIARRYWREAGVDSRIDLRLAPAIRTLDALLADGAAGSVDFMFIDADKPRIADYYERGVALLRPGGLLAIDNVFWSGRVADESQSDPDTLAIRSATQHVCRDSRVTASLVPIGDGLLLARRR